MIIDNGRIVAEGSPDALKRRLAGDVVTVEVADGAADRARTLLNGHADIHEIAVADQTLRLTVERGDQVLMSLLRDLDAADVPLASIGFARPTLDDVFLTLTGRSLRDDDPATTAA